MLGKRTHGCSSTVPLPSWKQYGGLDIICNGVVFVMYSYVLKNETNDLQQQRSKSLEIFHDVDTCQNREVVDAPVR